MPVSKASWSSVPGGVVTALTVSILLSVLAMALDSFFSGRLAYDVPGKAEGFLRTAQIEIDDLLLDVCNEADALPRLITHSVLTDFSRCFWVPFSTVMPATSVRHGVFHGLIRTKW